MLPRLHILLAVLLSLTATMAYAQVSDMSQVPDLSPAPEVGPTLSPLRADRTPEMEYDYWGRFRPRAAYRYEAGDSIGRTNGLSSVQAFVPFWEQENSQSLAFVDTRFLLFDNQTTPGTNVNLGFRSLVPSINRTLGGHLAYDVTDTNTNTFQQLSGGFETLGDWLDARANFYAPLGRQRRLLGSSFSGNTDSLFQGQFLMFGGGTQTNLYENAMTGFDTEVGGNVVRFGSVNLRAFVGTYYFGVDNGPDTWGGRARVEARISDRIALNFTVQRDRMFDTTVNVNVTLSWPSITGRRHDDQDDYVLRPADRLGESVERIQQIVVSRTTERKVVPREIALDPLTGAPLVFIHVAPGGNSDGSFENPYGSLAKAFADPRFASGNVVVYDRMQDLFTGNVTLAPGTRLLSAGPIQSIDTLNGGRLVLPFSGASTGLSALPRIQGTVTVGSNTTLSGFAITNTSNNNDLINQAPGSVVRNVNINNNNLTGGNIAVNLNNVAGSVDVVANRIQSPNMTGINVQVQPSEPASIRITDNNIGGAGLNGIYMSVNNTLGMSATVNASIERNTINNVGNNGINVGNAGITISDFPSGNGIGSFANSLLHVSIQNNQVSNATGAGIAVLTSPDNSVTQADIIGNQISHSGSTALGGLVLGAQSPAGSPSLIANVLNNQLIENFTAGLGAYSSPGNSLSLAMQGNTASSSLTTNGFVLDRHTGAFQVVDLLNLGNNNTGSINVTSAPLSSISTLP